VRERERERKLNNNKMIKNKLDIYLIPFTNGRLMHVNPKLYTMCFPWGHWLNNSTFKQSY
jgi:hypothetical protein